MKQTNHPSDLFVCTNATRLLLALVLAIVCMGCAQGPMVLTHQRQDSALATTVSYGSADQWRAINRLSYGPTPGLLAEIQSASNPLEWALGQLATAREASRQPARIPAELSSINASLPELFEGARKEREARAAVPAGTVINEVLPGQRRFDFSQAPDPLFFNRTQVNKAVAWRLAACSNDQIEHPLLARLTEFWFNHFNVFQQKGPVRAFAGHYALHVARAHALGRFEDLLLASARHPAMLYYLDQWLSVAPGRGGPNARGLNENYARELMELHTVGVQGGYTQQDVRELARIFSGWTVSPRSPDGFQFVMRWHDTGQKVWMGHEFPASPTQAGQAEGELAIRHLARHPSTARRIAQRLAEYFVSDVPPPRLVDALSRTFVETQGDLYRVMQNLIASPDFWATENRLFRTPFDFACGALRVLDVGAEINKWQQAFVYTAVAGQPVQSWQTPDGYSFSASAWMTPEALSRRIDFALNIARNAPERTDLYAYLGSVSLSAVMKQDPTQRMGLFLGSPEFIFK
ncbi:MAG: DUF1800 family protein [Limnohabitans sp.]